MLIMRILLLTFFFILAAYGESNEDSGEQKLQIQPSGLDGDKYVVKADKAFRIACVYNDEDMDDVHQLQWESEGGTIIDGSSSPTVFTIALHERETHHKKRSLVFSKINSRDSGTYTCIAKLPTGTLRRSIQVHVVGNIEWNEPREVIGAMVGESLTIDCSAKGNPPPEIELTNEEGEGLDDLDVSFVVANDEATVDSLTKEYQGKKVRCLALQYISEYATTSVEKHEISIDVWYKPEFEEEEVHRYAILGRSALLYCNVSASNPPVKYFTFYKNSEEINDDDEKYTITEDYDNQSAVLKIHTVEEDDLKFYRCEVNNGKAKADQIIHLHTANPPNQVRVSLERARKHSITWRLVEDGSHEDEELPVISYTIEYTRVPDETSSSEEDDSSANEESNNDSVWKSHSTHVIRTKNADNIYDVSGLVQNAKYIFRFTAQNEAGSGDPIEITAYTQAEYSDDYNGASSLSIYAWVCTVVFAIIFS